MTPRHDLATAAVTTALALGIAIVVLFVLAVTSAPAAASAVRSDPPDRPVHAGATLNGWATWYDDGPGRYGAVNSWRFGDTPYMVNVCAFGGVAASKVECVTVLIRDYCACGPRHGIPTVIDLSPAAFAELQPLSRGLVRVQVSGRIDIPLPATDMEATDD